jgi:hypothetical protein
MEALAFLKAAAVVFYKNMYPDADADGEWQVRQVLCFNGTQMETETYSVDVTRIFYDLPKQDWAQVIGEHQGWQNVADIRLEVRCLHHGEKYRLVYHSDDALDFPPNHPAADATATAASQDSVKTPLLQPVEEADESTSSERAAVAPDMTPPSGILAATLVCPVTDEKEDVSKRLRKYQGPYKNFFGKRLSIKHMFPFRSHDEESTKTLEVIDAKAGVVRHPYESTIASQS